MSSIADFEFNRFPLSEGVILVSQTIRRDFPADTVRESLQQLSEQALAHIDAELDQDQKLEQFIDLFFNEWGLAASAACTAYPMHCGSIRY